jgi:iron complex outermembrane receptor protein
VERSLPGGIPLSGVTYTLEQNSIFGCFRNYLIKRLPAGNIKVFVSYVGFSLLIHGEFGWNQVLNFALKQNTAQLQEVVIRQKSHPEHRFLNKRLKETIEEFSNQTLGDVLKEIAGVSSLKQGVQW